MIPFIHSSECAIRQSAAQRAVLKIREWDVGQGAAGKGVSFARFDAEYSQAPRRKSTFKCTRDVPNPRNESFALIKIPDWP